MRSTQRTEDQPTKAARQTSKEASDQPAARNQPASIMSGPKKSSLVDYSKVSHKAVHPSERAAAAAAVPAQAPAASAVPARPSAQMDAVMRLMTGREERTIAEKMADSNRPTWEQYKKDNHDKLNLEGLDQKEMEAYRQQLDEEREERMGGGKKTSKKKKKHRRRDDSSNEESDSDSSSSSSSSSDRKRKKRSKHSHRRKKHKRAKKRHHHSSEDDEVASDRESASEVRRKKSKRKHKKSRREKNGDGDDEGSHGSHYRLSNFFAEASDGG